ncbi:MAG: hypothetical protein PUJ55_00420 [Clostridiales bacterium]|nr:hypothetical protein [Roseburia sp.]MDD7635381.1 hypothetical protein [Clostridiales bacterium]
MTARQKEIYEYIIKYTTENLYPPTVREIAAVTGLKSTSSVYSHLKNLQKQGVISMRESEPRTIKLTGYKLVKESEIIEN